MTNAEKNALHSLRLLAEGNARFKAGRRSVDPAELPRRMRELAARGQRPFASVLACADSRVPVELVFDCGPGDLFVVRVAGNAASEPLVGPLASLEYAVAKLETPLCVVLGHSACGAVQSAVESEGALPPPSRHLAGLVEALRPAVAAARAAAPAAERSELVRLAVHENVRLQLEALRLRSPILREAERSGRLLLAGAVKDLSDGSVAFLDAESAVLGREGLHA